jgi:hypothetical protein
MQGITGKLSGKMGAAVFRVREGQQVVTQYNPIVKNPNTAGQQAQRAKFKLMSQLAAIMAPGFGTMGVTERPARGKGTARNGFVQKNFALAETETVNDTVTAKIPMEQLQLTDSFRYLPNPTVTVSAGRINVEMLSIPTAVTTVRIVLVGYSGGAGQDRQANIRQIVDVPVSDTELDYTFNAFSAGNYTVLAYGLIPSESAKSSIDLDNIHTPADEDFISAVQLDAMVADGLMAETKTVGANVEVTA